MLTSWHYSGWMRRARSLAGAGALALLLAGGAGCGMQGGAMAYWAGVGRSEKVKAEYTIPPGKVLILVDDDQGVVNLSQVRDLLVESLSQELLSHRAVTAVVDNDTTIKLRQSDERFERRGAREVGLLADADLVLWAQVQDFLAPAEIQDLAAARITVSVKVLNAREEQRREAVRLWPTGPGGQIVRTELSANDMSRLKGENAVAKEMAARLGRQIARLFYEYSLGELDDEK